PFDLDHIDRVAILTEGGRGIGYGHITRSVAVVQYLKEFGLSVDMFVRGDGIKGVFFEGEKYIEQDWLINLEEIGVSDNTAVFVDSYFADIKLYNKIYSTTKKLIIFDDYCRLKYDVGYVLNPVVEKDFYSGYDKVLYGEDFIFLRKGFWNVKNRVKNGDIRHILITLGGNPQKDLIRSIVEKIEGNFNTLDIKILSDPVEGINGDFTGFVDSKGMADLLFRADMAISAGGQTLHELFYMKVPTIMIKLAENQEYNIRFYEKRGFVRGNVDNVASYIAKKRSDSLPQGKNFF
ncbi:MAG: hypothetical protein LDL10_05095, partial [Calditerrivibrio sp.]|nr:hypothetical protein [Calditerrivibrio sp.]